VVGVLSAIVVPVLLYLDAKKLAGYDGDLEWTPSPGLYGLLGFLFTGLAVLDYLYKRQGVIVDREDRSGWWVVALAGLALPIAILLVGSVLGGSSLGFAGIAFGVLFPDWPVQGHRVRATRVHRLAAEPDGPSDVRTRDGRLRPARVPARGLLSL
jgi:hypothetical protein